MIRRLLGTTALAAALVLPAVSAGAQQLSFTSGVVFGDSLSDTNNLAGVLGPAARPGVPYVNGRFSNGDVWVDYFSRNTGVALTSRALGGARALTRTAEPVGITDLTPQVDRFLAGSPSINANQLFSIWIGGNDYLALLQAPTPPSSTDVQTRIGQVAATVGTQAGRLRAAGAQNFLLFNLPPLGQIPATSTAPAASRASANTLSDLHADAINGVAANLRASGATVVVVDMNTLFRDMIARPSVYGFSNVTVPCFVPPTAGATPTVPTGACATAAGAAASVFYDPIHPTTAAHSVVAQFANGTLVTALIGPQGLAAATQVGLDMFRQMNQSVSDRIVGAPAGSDGQYSVVSFGSWQTMERDSVPGQLGYENDAWNVGLGIDYRVSDSFVIGLAGTFGRSDADLDNAGGKIEADSYGLLVHANGTSGKLNFDGFMGYSFGDYGIDRSTGFAPLPVAEGQTWGHTWGAGANVGYVMGSGGGFDFGPTAGIRYAFTTIDGYTEEEAGPLNLTVEEFDAESLVSRLGVQTVGRFGSVVPRLALVWERENLNDDRRVFAGLSGGQPAFTDAEAGERDSGVVDAGISFASGALQGSLGYRGTVIGGNGDDHTIAARIRFGF